MNDAEKWFVTDALTAGYEVVRGGWPDFVLVKDDQVIFVEVKTQHIGKHEMLLSAHQLRMFLLLERLGLEVRISLDGDLTRLFTIQEYMKQTGRVHYRQVIDGKAVNRIIPLERKEA
jgi:Holliday junction resolvase